MAPNSDDGIYSPLKTTVKALHAIHLLLTPRKIGKRTLRPVREK